MLNISFIYFFFFIVQEVPIVRSESFSAVIQRIVYDFKTAYTNPYVLKWCIWWGLSYGIYNLVSLFLYPYCGSNYYYFFLGFLSNKNYTAFMFSLSELFSLNFQMLTYSQTLWQIAFNEDKGKTKLMNGVVDSIFTLTCKPFRVLLPLCNDH